MFEVLNSQKKPIDKSKILEDLNIKSGKIFFVSCHREENVDNLKNFKLLIDS